MKNDCCSFLMIVGTQKLIYFFNCFKPRKRENEEAFCFQTISHIDKIHDPTKRD